MSSKNGKGYWGKRFALTAGSLLAVFGLFAFGYDVSKLEFIIPAILAFYHGTDAWENVKNKEAKNDSQQANST